MSSTESPDASPVPPVPPVPPARPAHVRAGEELRTLGLPGLSLAVRSPSAASPGGLRHGSDPADDAGRGPVPVALFVHGLGGSSQNWSALMERLADLLDCEALDLPGFGDSPPPDDGDYSITAHARAVIRYLDASGRAPVHLFGNSLGGAVTTRVAAVRPDLVRTLTLVSPALPELPPQRTALPTAFLSIPGAARLFSRMTKDWTVVQRTREVLALCYGDPGRVTPEDFALAVAEYERRLTLPYFWDAMARSMRGLVDSYTLGGQHSLWRQAERVLAPTLLVYGLRDQLVGHRMARRASAAFRDSRLLTLVEAGHVAMMEFPDAVALAFRELLDEIEARQRTGEGVEEGREGPGSRGGPGGRSVRAGAASPGADGSDAARG
jgi:pimeloyl-ACP methyl ester carboxylesterase